MRRTRYVEWESLIKRLPEGRVPRFDLTKAKSICDAMPAARRYGWWRDAAEAWASQVVDAMNQWLEQSRGKRSAYRLTASQRVMVIFSGTEEEGTRWATTGEWVLDHVLPVLGNAGQVPPWPTICCFIHDIPTFDGYRAEWERQDRLLPAGAFIHSREVMPHIAVLGKLPRNALRLVFAHELIHSLVYHLDLPLWLNEGISDNLMREQLLMQGLYFVSDQALDWNDYFRLKGPAALAGYWSGKSFRHDGATASYGLAFRMVRRMMAEDLEQFQAFAVRARRVDAGDAACREIYGSSIMERAKEFLGAGAWQGPAMVEDDKLSA